jgi:hypothetical protein
MSCHARPHLPLSIPVTPLPHVGMRSICRRTPFSFSFDSLGRRAVVREWDAVRASPDLTLSVRLGRGHFGASKLNGALI